MAFVEIRAELNEGESEPRRAALHCAECGHRGGVCLSTYVSTYLQPGLNDERTKK